MKHFFLSALILTSITLKSTPSFSQVPVLTTYFKNDGTIVSEKENADYVQIIDSSDKGLGFYSVLEVFVNGKNKTIGYSNSIFPKFEGSVLTFYPSGKRKSSALYSNGKKVGESIEYYPNGNVYRILNYSLNLPYKTIIAKDSLGMDLVTNGNGEMKVYNSDFTKVLEYGNIINGYKHGFWRGSTDTVTYLDKYVRGNFTSGTSTDHNGNQHKYKEIYAAANFKPSIEEFTTAIDKHIKSSLAKVDVFENKKTKVYVQFIIGKDGIIRDAKVIHRKNQVIDKIAVEAITQSKKWQPAIYRGIPIDFQSEHLVTFDQTPLEN